MKKTTFFATIFMLFSIKIFGQVIYSENFGVINGSQNALIPLASHNGYQNQNVTYTSISVNSSTSVYITANMPSVGYLGASSGAHVLLDPPPVMPNTFTSNQFLIEGIDTSEFTDIQLTFGYGIPVYVYNSFNYDIIVEVSEDGIQWHQLNFVRNPVLSPPIGNTWQLASSLGTIPSVENLRLRFSNSSKKGEVIYWHHYTLLLDDILLTGTKKNVSIDGFEKAPIKIHPNPVTNGILNFQITDANDVNVELFDVTGKKVFSGKTNNNLLDVSSLKAGIYFIKVKGFDKLSTQKIIIK